MSTITQQDTVNALRSSGLSSYTGYAGTVTDVLNREGRDADALTAFAQNRGVRVHRSEVETFLSHLPRFEEEQAEQVEAEGFDREHAANVIREHASRHGVSEHAVESVLIEAGLVDEPVEEEPEIEAEEDDSMSAVARRIEATVGALAQQVEGLVGFARQHGFRG
jgi:hypothetical protein